MRPLISERSSVEKTARRRPTATISSEMVAVRDLTVGILSWRLAPKSVGLTCFHPTRAPQPSPPRRASTTIVRRMRLGLVDDFGDWGIGAKDETGKRLETPRRNNPRAEKLGISGEFTPKICRGRGE